MKLFLVLVCAMFVLCSCAAGPVYVAKTEGEAIRTTYPEKSLQELYNQNAALLKEIYSRFITNNVGIYNEGIGFTVLRDLNGEPLHYLMAFVRPDGLKFDMNRTKGEERFSHAIQQMPLYLKHIKSSDLDKKDVEGLAFGIYWGVKDYSQCDTYGGFVEYIHVYFRKADAQDILEGRRTYEDALKDAEVITSLDLKPAKTVKPVF